VGGVRPGPFWWGLGAHVLLWLAVINFDSTPMDMACGEISCWVLFFAELPVSLLYVSGSATQVTVGSLFVGSIWWGVVGYLAAWSARKLMQRRQN
jgi:hypothetical protein